MPFFTVLMTHPPGPAWATHLHAHVSYLLDLVDTKVLVASGPVKDLLPQRSGFLIIRAADRAELDRIVADDPFAKEDLIEELTVHEWDPLFGVFGRESSGVLPVEGLADLAERAGLRH